MHQPPAVLGNRGGQVSRPGTVHRKCSGLVRLRRIDGGVGGHIDHQVRMHLADDPPDSGLVGDVELGPGQPHRVLAGGVESGDEVMTQLPAGSGDQPAHVSGPGSRRGP